jgi:hypothetical protein
VSLGREVRGWECRVGKWGIKETLPKASLKKQGGSLCRGLLHHHLSLLICGAPAALSLKHLELWIREELVCRHEACELSWVELGPTCSFRNILPLLGDVCQATAIRFLRVRLVAVWVARGMLAISEQLPQKRWLARQAQACEIVQAWNGFKKQSFARRRSQVLDMWIDGSHVQNST